MLYSTIVDLSAQRFLAMATSPQEHKSVNVEALVMYFNALYSL
jgi:hypothetical protein